MKIVTAPEIYTPEGGDIPVFVAGGITGTQPWQSEFIEMVDGYLKDEPVSKKVVLLNPRRAIFNTEDKGLEQLQIRWEWEHLRMATAAAFWFTPETPCPIALFELGKEILRKKFVFVGHDLLYTRKTDILYQLRFERPDIMVVSDLNVLAFATAMMVTRHANDLAVAGPPFDGRHPAHFTGIP